MSPSDASRIQSAEAKQHSGQVKVFRENHAIKVLVSSINLLAQEWKRLVQYPLLILPQPQNDRYLHVT